MTRVGALLGATLFGLAVAGVLVALVLPMMPAGWRLPWLVWTIAGLAVALAVGLVFRNKAPRRR